MAAKVKLVLLLALTTILAVLPQAIAYADSIPCSSGC
jgi:hypothetical protein